MKPTDGIEDSFRFMVLEVIKQVEAAAKVLGNPDPTAIAKIESRDDYVDNLKSIIENDCFSRIHSTQVDDKRAVDFIRAVSVIAGNLERVADFAVDIVRQLRHLREPGFLKRYNYPAFFAEAVRALRLVVKALLTQDVPTAFRICRAEVVLDTLFKQAFDQVLADLRRGESPENCITAHNIFRYLERMGDAILNIGEAVIFAAVGEKFKIHQYEALKGSLAEVGQNMPISDGEFQSIWGTRSGCRIGKVESGQGGLSAAGVLFKEGNPEKLSREMENMGRWESVLPGLPPKVQSFHKEKDSASLLMEYLGGNTLQEVVLTADPQTVRHALEDLQRTAVQVWEKTRRDTPVAAGYIAQMRSRLDDVLRMHPSFRYGPKEVAGIAVPGLEELMARCEALEWNLAAPFTVFIHGDFNSNNIVYRPAERRIHYIDLHRSRDGDYLQDVSVLLVSIFRLPVTDQLLRARLNRTIAGFLDFSRNFARRSGDDTVEARLCLGLARSFVTSCRFEFKTRFARDMFQRGTYLLGKLARHAGEGLPWTSFVLPGDVLVY